MYNRKQMGDNTMKTVKTTWEIWTYDVWGNAEEGYDVNDRFCQDREYPINLKIEDNNSGKISQFFSAYPSNYQIQKCFGVGCNLDLEGDDVTIYVNRAKDGYPVGEMVCTSHSSLSPIREQ